MNKIVKLSVIRENEERACPFGLPVTEACENVGEHIDDMCPLEDVDDKQEKELVMKANNRVFIFAGKDGENCGQCKYANVIFDNEKVECSYGDYAAGMGVTSVNPGPMVNTYLDLGFYSLPFNSDYRYYDLYFFASDDDEIKKDNNDK